MEDVERINSLGQVVQYSVGPVQETMTQSEKGDDPDPAAEDSKDSLYCAIDVHFGFGHEDKHDEQDDSDHQSVPGLLVDGTSEARIGKNDEAVYEVDQVEQSEEVVVVVRT